jgi:hypothetical protein
VPLAQGVHTSGEVCPTRALAVPGAQAVQLGEAGEVEKEPAAQEAQEAIEVARREGWKVPGGQLEQAWKRPVLPGRMPYVPLGQGVSTPEGQYDPCGHSAQVADPVPE